MNIIKNTIENILIENEVLECENCGYTSTDEDKFECRSTRWGDILNCRECACCGQCRELITQLKRGN